jgi:hypothetical protein
MLHLRTVNMINYHISEVLAEAHHANTEFDSHSQSERQYMRKEIS